MKNFIYHLLFGITLMVSACQQHDESLAPVIPETGLSKYNVAIVNQANASVTFLLRPKDGDWLVFTLLAGEKKPFSCSLCDGRFDIKLLTDKSVPVEHELSAGALYAIRADYQRSRYDVYIVQ